jgi:hypothetical protein
MRCARLLGVGVLLTLGSLGLYLAFFRGGPDAPPGGAPPDPRRDYAGPFQNLDPAVHYVSDERCAECHLDKALAYAEHPMGRSLLRVGRAPTPAEDSRFHNPFRALGSQFQVYRDGDRIRHQRTRLDPAGHPAATLDWPVHYVLGSGTRGHSYLTDRDGYLFQTPISWFSQEKKWDLSPGFGVALLTGRAVLPECLFCHANRVHSVEGSVNHYRQPIFDGSAIGCQRCHGPGELHVATRAGSARAPRRPDYTIVNPRHLERPLREAVCEQCHLTGKARVLRRGRGLDDFRPGLPLELFWSVFVRPPEAGESAKAVSHVEQMYQSRCFQGSAGQLRPLGCISCHDPHEHVPAAERVAHYRGRCLRCHDKHPCSLPVADRKRRTAADSCIDCHMPRYGSADIPHTASTDHRILRHEKATPQGGAGQPPGDGLPIVAFYHGRKDAADWEQERDRAVALVNLALNGEPAAGRALGRALPALADAVRRDLDDHVAGEAHGHALGLEGRSAEALAAFQAVLARAPDRELALVGAAAMAEALGKSEAAQDYWRRAVRANPWAPDYRRRLALLLVKNETWNEAQRECQAWERLDPFSAEARATRISCLLAAGNKEEARAELARIEALAPPNLHELQIRFARRLK